MGRPSISVFVERPDRRISFVSHLFNVNYYYYTQKIKSGFTNKLFILCKDK